MTLLTRIGIVLGIVIVLVVAIGFALPQRAHVQRSIVVDAPPATVFALVDGFRQFDRWSPWSEKDPAMKVERSGPPFSVGAKYTWSGNKDVGSGSQEVIASTPHTAVRVKLEFSGFDQPSQSGFVIAPAGVGSKLTWTLDTELGSNPVNRYFGLAMDKMVGPDYARGVVRLKTLAESMPKLDFSSLVVELVDSKAQPYAFVSGSTTTDGADIAKALAEAYGKVGAFIKTSGLKPVFPPLAITRRFDEAQKAYEFDAAVPVEPSETMPAADGEVKLGQGYAGPALKVTHKGPYATLPSTYAKVAAYKTAYGLLDNGNSWERYVSDPGSMPEAELLTELYFPIK